MNGTIEVRPGAEPSKTARVQAIDEARQAPQTPFRFDPAELTEEAGTAIVFGNVGGKPHTLTADDGEAFDTGVVAPGPEGGKFAGSNATFVVTEPGTFPFHCEVHPAAMKGVLTVTGEAVASAPGAASAAPREATVEMRDFEFQNSEVAVAPRGSVTWRNVGAVQHSAQFDDVELDTGILQPGNEGSLTAPDDPGNYSYFCAVHPQRMRGVLVVLGQNVADPTEVALAKAPEAAGSGGPPGGIPALALATGVAGAFLGGMGVASFMRRRPPEAAIPAEAGGPETRAGPTALR
jgi:plastocyanin